ncbi:hypothetical protein BASA81_001045 [Batrachochytrium salamandrivorans]|nr:hypothetical protein BASA81_001045 [Batrachochytrium salamandrivorans]
MNDDEGEWDEESYSSEEGDYVRRPISFVQHHHSPQPEEEDDEDDRPSFAGLREAPAPPPIPLKGYSKMARMYMEKNGFSGRLGKHETGITAPLEALKRKEGAGLGFVQEASSLPGNRAFEEETIQRRKDLELKKLEQAQRSQLALELQNSWRKVPLQYAIPAAIDNAFPNEVLAGLEAAELVWKEREVRAMREIQVNASIDSIKTRQNLDHQADFVKVDQRVRELELVVPILHKLQVHMNDNNVLQQSLLELKHLPQKVTEDFELGNVPFLLLGELIDSRTTLESCLTMATFVQLEFPFQHVMLKQVLQSKLLPQLKLQCELTTQLADLAKIYHPWVVQFPTLFDLEADLDFGLYRLLRDCASLDLLLAWLPEWIPIVGPTVLQQRVADRLGDKLALMDSLPLLALWHQAQLLSTHDLAILIEMVLHPVLREGGKFYNLCQSDSNQVPVAAALYLEYKSHVPIQCLQDECGGGRLRCLFDYALELMRLAIDRKPLENLDVGILNSIEPEPRSFGEAKHLALLRATGAKQVAGEGVVGSLKSAVESLALGVGLEFHPNGTTQVDGKQVYVLGSSLCYFARGVVFASPRVAITAAWKPVSIPKLVEMSRA